MLLSFFIYFYFFNQAIQKINKNIFLGKNYKLKEKNFYVFQLFKRLFLFVYQFMYFISLSLFRFNLYLSIPISLSLPIRRIRKGCWLARPLDGAGGGRKRETVDAVGDDGFVLCGMAGEVGLCFTVRPMDRSLLRGVASGVGLL